MKKVCHPRSLKALADQKKEAIATLRSIGNADKAEEEMAANLQDSIRSMSESEAQIINQLKSTGNHANP